MAVSKRLRFEVLKRDNNTCRYCGGRAPDVVLTIDHVVPVTLGGGDEPGNLVAACKDCNAGKSSVPADAPLIAGVAEDALRMAKALEIVAEQRAAERKEAEAIYRKFKREWRSWYTTDWRGDKHYVELPGDWQRSIDQFLDAGLVLDDLLKMVGVALGGTNRGGWKYFCGCCWNLVRDIRERAAALSIAEKSPSEPPLRTIWTAKEAEDYVSSIVFNVEQLGFKAVAAGVGCIHQDGMHCGDPICAIAYASELIWYVVAERNDIRNAEAILLAAEEALDG